MYIHLVLWTPFPGIHLMNFFNYIRLTLLQKQFTKIYDIMWQIKQWNTIFFVTGLRLCSISLCGKISKILFSEKIQYAK